MAYRDPLHHLTPAQRRAWSYILEYLRSYGKRCFTYNDLARFWPNAATKINIQTLDRRVRELVSLGILDRKEEEDGKGRTRVRFCLKHYFYMRFVKPFLG